MSDQLIFEFIALKYPVRAVQVADKFDVALADASDVLRSLVDVGDLTRTAGTGPNMQPAQFYALSETFLKSKEGKLVIARMEAAQAALAAAVAAPVATAPAPTPPAAPSTPSALASAPPPAAPAPNKAGPAESASTAAGASRVERAIACITERGSVPDADLRVVMGLRAGQYPSGWLTMAVRSGQVRKDGRDWMLGTGTPPAPIKKQQAFGGSLGLPGATPFPAAAPKPAAAAHPAPAQPDQDAAMETNETAAPIAVDTAPPLFRCGLWSDGVLELQRNGVTVAQLEQGEGEALAAFMARLQQPMTTAA